MKRQIIRIDEELCTGCGECVLACMEGALQIVDGKARVLAEVLCDGLGACLGECPEGALSIEVRDAPEFDEIAVEERRKELECEGIGPAEMTRAEKPGLSPSGPESESLLTHWPVQLGLVNPAAPHLRGADLLIVADCVPVAYRRFQEDFLQARSVVMACPKLDDARAHLEKLADIFRTAKPRSVKVLTMEVPCCFGLNRLVRQAADFAELEAPIDDVVITVAGRQRS
jgi:NAD-dependent dihydropyrimidine dehydrogenase PreA subunit